MVWAAGVTAGPVAAELGVERTRGGRLVVGPDLSVPGHPEVFAIGDIAAARPTTARAAAAAGGAAAPSRAAATPPARSAAASTVRPAEPFHYHDKGSMATIGRNEAVTELPGGIRL